jgi:hypothetical protein
MEDAKKKAASFDAKKAAESAKKRGSQLAEMAKKKQQQITE